MDKIVRYGKPNNYKEGLVISTRGKTLNVLRMYHVEGCQVREVWLGTVDSISDKEVCYEIKCKPFWFDNIGVAMEAYINNAYEEFNEYYHVA